MVIDGVDYRFQVASDVTRDGIGIECYRISAGVETFLLEVFRSDRDGTLLLHTAVPVIPFALVAHLATIVPQQLDGQEA